MFTCVAGVLYIYLCVAGVLMDTEDSVMTEKEVLDTFRRNPYRKIANYAKAAGYRLLDLFKDFDKDGSMTITKDEFENGIKVSRGFAKGYTVLVLSKLKK